MGAGPMVEKDKINKIKNANTTKKLPGKKGKKRSDLEQKLSANLSRLSQEPENTDLLKELRDIYIQLDETKEASEVEQKLKQVMEKKAFEANLGSRIVLKELELQDLDFFGDFSWTFQPRVNVLLGKNGFGKSHLLRFLVALLQKDVGKSAEFFEHSRARPLACLSVEREGEPKKICRNKIVFENSMGKVPILAIPDMRFIDKSNTIVSITGESKEEDLSRQWSYHFLFQKPVEGLIQEFLYQLCITYLDKGKTFDIPVFQLLHQVIGKLSDHQFKFHQIELTSRAGFKVNVITEGTQNPMPIQKASQGTLSVLAIFGLIYSYLNWAFPRVQEKDLVNQPAIVFIDEIDAHLHPSWQKKIVGLLRECFPKIQLVVTAHSPLVVAGCKEGEVAVLKKGFIVKRFEQDFIGYETRQLYEKVFEVEEKDDNYLYYNALYPFRGDIREEINRLEKEKKEKGLSKKKEQRLSMLYDDLYYSEKAYEMYQKRREYSRVLIENRKLKAKIKKLENRGPGVG